MHESEKWKGSCSVVSDPQRSHGLQPTRLLHPWDFPGKSTGVGCHCLFRYLGEGVGICRNWVMAHFLTFMVSLGTIMASGACYLIYWCVTMEASLVAETVKHLPTMQESWVWSLDQEDPMEKGMATHSVFLPGESHGQRSLAGYSPWGRRVGQLSDFTFPSFYNGSNSATLDLRGSHQRLSFSPRLCPAPFLSHALVFPHSGGRDYIGCVHHGNPGGLLKILSTTDQTHLESGKR